jgi:hypothetical protein
MALFLSESIDSIQNEEVSDIDMMTSLMEAQQEMAMFTESVLRADFILHEQCRTLLENEGDGAQAEVKEKEKGFLSNVWDFLVKIIKSVGKAIMKAFHWVKDRVHKFWNLVRKTYARVKYWFLSATDRYRIDLIVTAYGSYDYIKDKILNLLGSTPTEENWSNYKLDIAARIDETEYISRGIEQANEISKKIDQISSEDLEIKINELTSIIEKLKNDNDYLDNQINSLKGKLKYGAVSDATIEKLKVKLAETATRFMSTVTRQAVWSLNLLTSLKAVKESNDEIDRKALERKNNITDAEA